MEVPFGQGQSSLCWQLYSETVGQCQARSRYTINVCWMNEQMAVGRSLSLDMVDATLIICICLAHVVLKGSPLRADKPRSFWSNPRCFPFTYKEFYTFRRKGCVPQISHGCVRVIGNFIWHGQKLQNFSRNRLEVLWVDFLYTRFPCVVASSNKPQKGK